MDSTAVSERALCKSKERPNEKNSPIKNELSINFALKIVNISWESPTRLSEVEKQEIFYSHKATTGKTKLLQNILQ
jgi:hypothetical protein